MSDFSELTRLAADLGKASADVTRKASMVVRKSAFDIERFAKTRAPVDTGNLRNSISTAVGSGGLSAEIGPTAHYGIYLEYGTRHISPPRPYMGPATAAVEPSFVEAIEQLGGTFLD